MPLNIPGLLVPFQLLINPRLALPGLKVKDIRHLDFQALRKAGYRGAVFDKDNCLTLPHRDTIVPELQETWKQCRETFGEGNILIVSNSAGTRQDAGDIQAESVTHHLRAPVLRHKSLKPAYSCIGSIRNYFSSLQVPVRDDELIVVGDRIFTDVVMANRMKRRTAPQASSSPQPGSDQQLEEIRTGPLAIWTTGVWTRESMVMRWFEKTLVNAVTRWSAGEHVPDSQFGRFIRDKDSEQLQTVGVSILSRLRSRLRRN